MPQKRANVGSVHSCTGCRFLLQIRKLLDSRVVQDAAHELELLSKPEFHDLIDSAASRQDSDPCLGTGCQAEAVNSVETLKKTAGHEVSVHVHGVVAVMMKTNTFAKRGGIGYQDMTARITTKTAQLLLTIEGPSMNCGRIIAF